MIMRKITDYLLMLVMVFALTSCSDDPDYINPESIEGEWYMTRISGWEYDNESPTGKYEFKEKFEFNSQGTPVGNNREYAQKIRITYDSGDLFEGVHYYSVESYYWSLSYRRWLLDEKSYVRLEGNQLIDGTMRVTITEVTGTTMSTLQSDEDGETYVTYTRL